MSMDAIVGTASNAVKHPTRPHSSSPRVVFGADVVIVVDAIRRPSI